MPLAPGFMKAYRFVRRGFRKGRFSMGVYRVSGLTPEGEFVREHTGLRCLVLGNDFAWKHTGLSDLVSKCGSRVETHRFVRYDFQSGVCMESVQGLPA